MGLTVVYCYLGVHGVNSGLLLFRCSWGEQWLLLFRCSWGEQWLLLFRCSRVSYKSYFLWPMNMMFSASYSLFSLSSESPKLSNSVTRVIIQISRIAWIVFTNTKLIEGTAYCRKCLRVASINFLTGENAILQAYIIQYSYGIISLAAVFRFKNAEFFRWIMTFISP